MGPADAALVHEAALHAGAMLAARAATCAAAPISPCEKVLTLARMFG